MLRSHTCGELRITDQGKIVTLIGWAHHIRDKGGLFWIDLRDGYGTTQLFLDETQSNPDVLKMARKIGREFVIQAKGEVIERQSKNKKIATGEIELFISSLTTISSSSTPPFTIENDTDGGESLRMKYRYLDLRRDCMHKNILLRHQIAQEVRSFLNLHHFIEIETPALIKSTPEGARDFVVPSRTEQGSFYALPQSPQTFKQLLIISGFDRYYQLVKCFRDEDLRADRQPEFTQIDCELAFVHQDDVISIFTKLIQHLFKQLKGIDIPTILHMTYEQAITCYGSDKPDIRYEMLLTDLTSMVKGKGFSVVDKASLVVGICVKGCATYTRKQLDEITAFVKKPQVGGTGLLYVRCHQDGTYKSSVDKFYDTSALTSWAKKMNALPGDLLLILAGEESSTYKAMGELRLFMGQQIGLQDCNKYAVLWVVDFPLFEWDEETHRFYAKHHPFTAPHKEDIAFLDSNPKKVRARAYDLVINGVEIGGGSIRIHDDALQHRLLKILGFTDSEAKKEFGFLIEAFSYGAPPHGGIALGFDRLCALFSNSNSIRDVIAFPKNNAGKDLMIDTPSRLTSVQLDELGLSTQE